MVEPFTAALIATIVITEAIKVPGKKLGEVVLEKSGTLVQTIRERFGGKVKAIEPSPDRPVDLGEAVIEIEQVAKQDPIVAQALQELAAAVEKDSSETAAAIRAAAQKVAAQAPTVANNAKLAETIKNVFQGNTIIGGNF